MSLWVLRVALSIPLASSYALIIHTAAVVDGRWRANPAHVVLIGTGSCPLSSSRGTCSERIMYHTRLNIRERSLSGMQLVDYKPTLFLLQRTTSGVQIKQIDETHIEEGSRALICAVRHARLHAFTGLSLLLSGRKISLLFFLSLLKSPPSAAPPSQDIRASRSSGPPSEAFCK